jgi:tetratricopeptide (TPR) repeat protein
MKKILFVAAFIGLVVPRLFAQTGYLKTSDRLSFEDKNQASADLLLQKLPTVTDSKQQAEIYWRLSRDTLHATEDLKFKGASAGILLGRYLKGESYADKAIELDPNNAKGYYWKASNIGRWGQTRGILASLFKANSMRKLVDRSAGLDPSQGDPWFLLGQLYEQVPGFPISFGNVVYSVSLGRKAVDARKAEKAKGIVPNVPYDYSIQLARHLAKRNWTADRRVREHAVEAQRYAQTTGVVQKNDYYEGVVRIPPISDRQEAIRIDQRVVSKMELIPDRSESQQRDLKNAMEDLTTWMR